MIYRLLDKVYDWITNDRFDEVVVSIWLGVMFVMVGLLAVAAVIR